MAGFSGVDGGDGDPGEVVILLEADLDHFDFKLETALLAVEQGFHQAAADQAVTGLVVWDVLPNCPGEDFLAEGVGQAADGGHVAELALTDDQVRLGGGIGGQEEGDLLRVVLAVGVEGDDSLDAVLEGPAKAKAQGSAFALVGVLEENLGARRFSGEEGGVVRAVVDDEDGEMVEGGGDDGTDAGGFVVGGDEGYEVGGGHRGIVID